MASFERPRNPDEVLKLIRDTNAEVVDLRFCDMPGTWQHFTLPLSEVDEKLFTEGSGFDGSSVRGFQAIDESDMLFVADATTAVLDPFYSIPTVSILADVVDPITGQTYSRDPRNIAKKAEAFLSTTGIADTSFWGPEPEFFVFDSIRMDQNAYSGYYFIDSDEGAWNTGAEFSVDGDRNLGYRVRHKEGYAPVPPNDSLQDIRTEMMLHIERAGIRVEKHHHEVATAGQGEISMRFDTLVRMADNVMTYKYVVKNTARQHGKIATFMPKPLFGDNGTGMHVHQSVWKDGVNLFYADTGYANLSPTGLHYIGGLLKHAPALLAFCAPTTNSYRRLVPGFEAPVNLALSMRNRSASARIPAYFPHPAAKRVEFRCPDPSANPYLAFAAMLMAGIDGIINETDPGEPLDTNIYELSPEQAAKVRQVPGSLDESLRALEEDHDFLLQGGVFTPDVISTWLDYKRERELDPMRLRPHPYEYFMYVDA